MSKTTKLSAHLAVKNVAAPTGKTVRVIVTAPTLDRDGDVIDTPSLRIPLKGGGYIYARELTGSEAIDVPLFTDHIRSVEKVIGSARSAIMSESGELEMEFVFSSRELATEMHTLLKEGHLDNAWSQTILYDPMRDVAEGVIYDAEVAEVSLVWRGSNYNARLLEVSKSLEKGLNVKQSDVEEKRKRLKGLVEEAEALQKELEGETETPEPSEPVTPEPETPEEPEAPEVEEPEQPEVPEPEKPEPVEEKEEPKQPEDEKPEAPESGEEEKKVEEKDKSVAQKQAGTAVSDVEEPVTAVEQHSENEHKTVTVKQLRAFVTKNFEELRELNELAKKIDAKKFGQRFADTKAKAIKNKEITYTDGAPLYLAEQLDRDVDRQYEDVGNVGRLVNRINLTQSPKYRKIVRTDGVRFQPVGFKGVKPQDKPTWGSYTLEPKPFAVIVAWSDHVAEDAMINTYNEIVADLAEARSYLEDLLILDFEGVTVNDTVFPDQGLLQLLPENREVEYGLTADSFMNALAEAWGKIHSSARRNLSLVMNGSEWGYVATLRDTQGRPLWSGGEGQRVNLGALGMVNIATSEILAPGQSILGDMRRYDYAEKGGLQLKASSEATLGTGEDTLNLFTEDASALRAVVRAEGGTVRTNAFVKLVRPGADES